MVALGDGGQSFEVRRTLEWESAGSLPLFDVTVRDGDRDLVLHRLSKGDLLQMRMMLAKACREAS